MAPMIFDTCCLINLYASQRLWEIVRATTEMALIPRRVLSEILYVRDECEDDPDDLVPLRVDLDSPVEKGLLVVTDLTGIVELESFVRFATLLDDGEAACLAIAANRNLILATDDRRAQHVAADAGVPTVTTPELLMFWMDRVSPEANRIANAIKCIERYGRFRPHHSSPHARWWDEQRGDL